MARKRADAVLVARGLAPTRAKAQEAIAAGGVTANGALVTKASSAIAEDADIICAPPHPWVSRAGVKLAHALDAFAINPRGRVCLDIGASTGGFTQVLLAGGAARVYAVDVGRAQLDDSLRRDTRVVVMEDQDARALTREMLAPAPCLIVCDASFIGLEKVLVPALSLAATPADAIALIKPQFETGPRAKAQIAASEAKVIAEAVAQRVDGAAGFIRRGFIESPIPGGAGAVEFLLWLTRTGPDASPPGPPVTQ